MGIKKGIGVFAEKLIKSEAADIVYWHGAGVRLRHDDSGTSTLALGLAGTGVMFPFSSFLGWLGVFLTGSDTPSMWRLVHCNRPRRSKINV
ncbi:L-lactate permease [Escherichia coli]